MKNKNVLVFVVLGIAACAGIIFLLIRYMDNLIEIFNEIKRSISKLELKSSGRSAKIDVAEAEDLETFEEQTAVPSEE